MTGGLPEPWGLNRPNWLRGGGASCNTLHTLPGSRPRTISVLIASLSLLAPSAGLAARKTSPGDLAVEVERLELPNGLVVLLCSDPSAAALVVDISFRAGAVREPPERSGLAHLVEHVFASGPTPESDYLALLEARGASLVNAYTGPDHMTFRAVVPAEELPLALWVAADRLMTIPGLLDQVDLEKHRRIVLRERAETHLDVPFGSADDAIYATLFPAPHPLRGMVIGRPEELAQVTRSDVQRFAEAHLVASNGVLTVVGRFDAEVAKRWIADTVGRLPIKPRPPQPATPNRNTRGGTFELREAISRRPRVTALWPLEGVLPDAAELLDFGALLLTNYVDGAFGTDVEARLLRLGDERFFRLDVTLPYDKPVNAAEGEAEVFLRYLTAVDMPRDFFEGAQLRQDRLALFALDTVIGRATLLTHFELTEGSGAEVGTRLEAHWRLLRHDVQHAAWKHLITGAPRTLFHARPVRPLKPKLDWDER